MPKALERRLQAEAIKKGLAGDRKNAYVFGTLQKVMKKKKAKGYELGGAVGNVITDKQRIMASRAGQATTAPAAPTQAKPTIGSPLSALRTPQTTTAPQPTTTKPYQTAPTIRQWRSPLRTKKQKLMSGRGF